MILSLTVLDNPISDKTSTQKSILQTAGNELQVIRECENINTQEND